MFQNMILTMSVIDLLGNKNRFYNIFRPYKKINKEVNEQLQGLEDKMDNINKYFDGKDFSKKLGVFLIVVSILYYIFTAIYVNNIFFTVLTIYFSIKSIRIISKFKNVIDKGKIDLNKNSYDVKGVLNDIIRISYPVITICTVVLRLI